MRGEMGKSNVISVEQLGAEEDYASSLVWDFYGIVTGLGRKS